MALQMVNLNPRACGSLPSSMGGPPKRPWHGPDTPPRLPKHGGTWQVEALLLPRALRGRVQGGRRRGAGGERRCRRGGRGGRRGRGIAAGVWLVRDRDVVLQRESRAGGGARAGNRGAAVRGSGAGRDSTARVLGPQTLPESCLLRQPRQGAPSCGGDSC